MEFTSTNILKKEERYEVRGLLNLRGIKKKVTLFVYSEEQYKEDANSLKFRGMTLELVDILFLLARKLN